MRYKSPLRLFWYQKEQNFGDAISATIVSFVSGREVKWAPHRSCEMYALGSLMKMVANHQVEPRDKGGKPILWGTGLMSNLTSLEFLKNIRVALLRGPITSALLKRSDKVFGDTGLLIKDALGAAPARQDMIGLVPHMHFADDPRFAATAAADPRVKLIDVRHPDAHEVVRQIASCAHVFSQSLHGLVTADAYGIPNTWIDPKGIHGGAMLKFHDYGAGVGRAMGRPIEIDQIAGLVSGASTGSLPYADGISAAKTALLDSFPDGLKQRELVS